jgi:ParB family transcriptional regulator, chromosome partitioning protein
VAGRVLTLKQAVPPSISQRDRRELLTDGERAEQGVKDVVYLHLDDIELTPEEINSRTIYDDSSIEELAASLRDVGFLQPLIVRPIQSSEAIPIASMGRLHDPSYVLIAGNRRYRAARIAGIQRAPCIIRIADRDTAFILNLIENAQRKELSHGERLRAISLLAAMHDAQGRSPLTYTQIRERTRLGIGTISSWIRIARRPILREAVERDDLDIARAMVLVRLDDERLARVLPEAARMPRTELEDTVKSLRNEMAFPRSRKARTAELDTRRLMEAYRLLTLVHTVPVTAEALDLWRMLEGRVADLRPHAFSPGEDGAWPNRYPATARPSRRRNGSQINEKSSERKLSRPAD